MELEQESQDTYTSIYEPTTEELDLELEPIKEEIDCALELNLERERESQDTLFTGHPDEGGCGNPVRL